MRVPHLALDFSPWDQCCHGVDNDDVDGSGADQHVGDFQGLLTSVWLAYQKCVNVYTKCLCVLRVQSVLGVDKGSNAAIALCVRNRVKSHGGLSGRLWTVNLNNSALWKSADTKCDIQRDGAG